MYSTRQSFARYLHKIIQISSNDNNIFKGNIIETIHSMGGVRVLTPHCIVGWNHMWTALYWSQQYLLYTIFCNFFFSKIIAFNKPPSTQAPSLLLIALVFKLHILTPAQGKSTFLRSTTIHCCNFWTHHAIKKFGDLGRQQNGEISIRHISCS